jgi:hypothetical protein
VAGVVVGRVVAGRAVVGRVVAGVVVSDGTVARCKGVEGCVDVAPGRVGVGEPLAGLEVAGVLGAVEGTGWEVDGRGDSDVWGAGA